MPHIKSIITLLSLCIISGLYLLSCGGDHTPVKKDPAKMKIKGTMNAELTAPPFVPAPVGDRRAKKLIINMEILEKEGPMTDGVQYVYWTFGGSVPGSFIRTRVGDEVEFTLSNHPDNKLPHNIDLHAVTGPGLFFSRDWRNI